jgi:predicted lactoylglutathione lyase
MNTKIFVNLPVRDLQKSISFYEGIGFRVNPQFTDDTAACIVINDDIYIMLLTHAKFKEFTPRIVSDSFNYTEVINALTVDSKEDVRVMMDKVLANGGSEIRDPQDYGFMFNRSFGDPDGHIWEVFWMDPKAVEGMKE